MTLTLVCAAILAALVFILGANVTRLRVAGAKRGAPFAPSDPANPLYKAIRAHGNAIEYIPTLLVLFLLDAIRAPSWTLVSLSARPLRGWRTLSGCCRRQPWSSPPRCAWPVPPAPTCSGSRSS